MIVSQSESSCAMTVMSEVSLESPSPAKRRLSVLEAADPLKDNSSSDKRLFVAVPPAGSLVGESPLTPTSLSLSSNPKEPTVQSARQPGSGET